jgi:hypothetical protein
MNPRLLRSFLDGLADTGELVVRDPALEIETGSDALFASWSMAAAEARSAYEEWRSSGGPEAYVVYRACADREDAAQDALAARARV